MDSIPISLFSFIDSIESYRDKSGVHSLVILEGLKTTPRYVVDLLSNLVRTPSFTAYEGPEGAFVPVGFEHPPNMSDNPLICAIKGSLVAPETNVEILPGRKSAGYNSGSNPISAMREEAMIMAEKRIGEQVIIIEIMQRATEHTDIALKYLPECPAGIRFFQYIVEQLRRFEHIPLSKDVHTGSSSTNRHSKSYSKGKDEVRKRGPNFNLWSKRYKVIREVKEQYPEKTQVGVADIINNTPEYIERIGEDFISPTDIKNTYAKVREYGIEPNASWKRGERRPNN